ncbi:MAG: TIGR03617 family F420-dependent LLM class oxidoreductase [Deltaproteobacteria bacterium]|nr:TIGR03617 family F420-dependent LLM class oxidoreductase [Deltaproteobacteria bacterium]
MRVYTTAPLEDPRDARATFPALERAGYDGAFSFEAKHDPFLPLAVAAEHTTRLRLGTAVAIAFARNPMTLANLGWDLQALSGGRFLLGLGTQVRPHVERRFGAAWSRPVERMRELVRGIRAIWAAWEGRRPLRFEGAFYHHTLMIPAFDPGPNPFGPPPIYLGGVGPRMIEAAGEVADGFIAHPFATRRSLVAHVLPALGRGLARAGRRRADVDVVCATIVVTAEREEDLVPIRRAVKKQLAFYGSTPAYRPTLACEGYDALHPELNRLSKEGRWDDMTALVDDALLDAIAVVAPRREVAGRLRARLADLADAVSLTNNRAPDPTHWADVVADLRAAPA